MENRDDLKFRARSASRVILIGLVCNVLLMVFKVTVGVRAKSSALVADGVNSLSDSITDAVALLSFFAAGRPRDDSHDFGHAKFETLATFLKFAYRPLRPRGGRGGRVSGGCVLIFRKRASGSRSRHP